MEIIDKKTYNLIASQWKGKVYQKLDKLQERLPLLLRLQDKFAGCRVLEIGSNAGMYAYHLAPLAESYIGVERDPHYYSQAQITKKYVQAHSIVFFNASLHAFLKSFPDAKFDTFLCSYVIHHLRQKEIAELRDIVFPKCNKVFIQTRSGDPMLYGHKEALEDAQKKWNKSIIKRMLENEQFVATLHQAPGMHLIYAARLAHFPGGETIPINARGVKVHRRNLACPNDGIHRKKESGGIRGFYWAKTNIGDLFFGNWSYYRQLDEERGIKVFYSIKFAKASSSYSEVIERKALFEKLAERGFCPKPEKIVRVAVNMRIDGERMVGAAYGIVMEHVNYPKDEWRRFAMGFAYNWKIVNHPNHTPEGFKAFRDRLIEGIKDIKRDWDSFSIGNIVYCTRKNQWFLVDIR